MNVVSQERKTWHATVDTSGRVLLPAELRHERGIVPGAEIVWIEGDKGLELRTFDSLLGEIQEYFATLGPSEELWSEELLHERRQEAACEDAEEDGVMLD